MKKVSTEEIPSSAQVSINQMINPEQPETRCRICFEEKIPLVTPCQCTGSIAYVHQDCILDWIALKMLKSELIEIPKCEICKVSYSAALKIGSKKIDSSLLMQKIKKSILIDWIVFIFSVLAYIIALLTIFTSILGFVLGRAIYLSSFWEFATSLIQFLFVKLGFPCLFIKERSRYFKQKWKIIENCKVQLVEVTLLPKKILKA